MIFNSTSSIILFPKLLSFLMKLLIFDIDGTLTHLAGATRRAFNEVFIQLFDKPLNTASLKLHGRTDPLIFRDCFYNSGLSGDWEAAYKQFQSHYLKALPGAIEKTENAYLHPGVEELLTELDRRREQAALALGTGNMEGGGRAKVGRFGLNRYFPVGGFADSHEDRRSILQDAIRRAEEHWGKRFEADNTWVIGDTPHDVAGGKALGLKTLAVATGGAYSFDELQAAEADVVMHNLADTKAVLTVFGLQ